MCVLFQHSEMGHDHRPPSPPLPSLTDAGPPRRSAQTEASPRSPTSRPAAVCWAGGPAAAPAPGSPKRPDERLGPRGRGHRQARLRRATGSPRHHAGAGAHAGHRRGERHALDPTHKARTSKHTPCQTPPCAGCGKGGADFTHSRQAAVVVRAAARHPPLTSASAEEC